LKISPVLVGRAGRSEEEGAQISQTIFGDTGVDAIFEGASLVAFAIAIRQLPGPSAHQLA
jgi:hypothetical protein